MWTGVRAGSIARLRCGDYYEAGEQWMLRFDEKRRRTREIPVRHDLHCYLRDYVEAASLTGVPKNVPLFLTSPGKTDRFTINGVNGHDICRMVKRYAKKAGLPNNLSPHSLRVAVATDLLDQGVPLSDVQYLSLPHSLCLCHGSLATSGPAKVVGLARTTQWNADWPTDFRGSAVIGEATEATATGKAPGI